jgi:CHAT domain-containing protein/tetratricopeptide (TPR) repeat protein
MISRRFALLPILVVCGCSRRPSEPGDLYRESDALRRRGVVLEAIEVADRGWRQWQSQPEAEWHWKFRLLKAELLLNQGRVAPARELLEADGKAPPPGELNARYLADLGQVRQDSALVEQAFAIASRDGYSSLLPSIQLKRASLDGYTEASEALIKNALAVAQAQSDAYLETVALIALGFERSSNSRFDEAIPWFERAESLARREGIVRLRERALGDLGRCYYHLGDFDRAATSLSLAIALAREVADDDSLHRWLNDIGNVHYRRREFAQAIVNYQAAADQARRVNNESALIMALNNLTATSFENGDLASAERYNSQAGALIAKTNDSESRLHAQLHTAWIEAARKQPAESSFRAVIDSATRQRDPLVLWEAEAGLARILQSGSRDAEADTQYRNALTTIEGEWSKLGEDRHKVTFLAQLISFYQDYVAFLVGRGETERAAAVADSARARVLAETLGVEPGARKIATRVPKTGPILLSYWLAPVHSYLWLIDPGGIFQFVLSGEARIASLVNQYNADILRGHNPLTRDNPAGRALYQELVAPARSLIPAGSSIIVIPDGPLHGLNFETLIVDIPTPHYWIEDVTLAVAPALGVLQPATPRRAMPARLLLIGDPEAADPAFPPLPHLSREVEILQRSFPSLTRLTGQQANAQAYRTAQPGTYSLIHFAAHAVANAESPLNSAVILSKTGEDYKLYAKDLLEQPLRADLVTISACHSAGARSYPGEGLLGFTWAVLQAGARNVVAGLWNADDAATSELMGEFYGHLASGASPAAALRLAKLKLLKSVGQNQRPYYWGAFQLFTRSNGK